ncbi:hypothetical protein N0V94_002147 [Neodidymelliopsis sp. IMI 364377]|nr:hypothetical protein N0V94_002147 [Neodidymelliopsis sp. IMI 364377]
MTKYRTTKVQTHGFATIPLLWFVRANEEERESIQSALNEVVDRLIEKTPELKKRQIANVPWLRNYTASALDVFATARGCDVGGSHVLGIDAQGLEDKTLLVLHCVDEKEPEIGRAAREEAVGALLKDQLYRHTLAEAFDGGPWTKIPVPSQSLEPTVGENEIEYMLPSHIPSGIKLQEDTITLFSLIKLTDKEMFTVKQDMGDTTDEITIYNWPHETPASQAETYSIFQCVKPELPVHHGQTFVLFIDAAHISGPQRAPVVVVACESATDDVSDESRRSKLELMRYKHIYLHAERAQQVRALWPLIWHPPNRGSVNDVVVNYPLFYGSKHHDNEAVMRYHSSFIAKPGLAICATGATAPEYVVYILCPVSPSELRSLRDILLAQNGDVPQFIELNIVPRRSTDEDVESTRKALPSDKSRRLDPLLAFFDSSAYRAVADPPDMFIFLDNNALDELLSGLSNDPSVPLATVHHHFHREELTAMDEPAYLYSNIKIEEGLESTLANLSVGNMWFWELVGCYGDDLHVAFWPEYRGSMTREMLDIEWEWS